jgi:hypothetical protein
VFFTSMPFGILGFIFPLFFIIIALRVVRSFFRSSTRRDLESRIRKSGLPGPADDYSTVSRYSAPIQPVRKTGEGEIFRLADKMKGRLTLSDIVIATNLSMHDAEQVIESMVDAVHVTMEVNDSGGVVYEFPEIISRYEKGK